MDIKHKIGEIRKLFSEKKFDEVLNKINAFSKIKERPSELSSLSGICKILKSNPTQKEIISALTDFKDSYFKSKTSNNGLDSVCNYISTCILYSSNYPELFNYFNDAKILYDEAESNFGYNEKLYIAGLKLHKSILDYDKMREINASLVNNNTKHLTTLCRWAYINNYCYKWKQEDYFDFSKVLKEHFPSCQTESVSGLYFKDKEKIKIGFVSCNYNAAHSITYFMKEIIENMDKKKFEIHAFDLGRYGKYNQPISEFKIKFDFWHELKDKSNQEVINFIQKNKIEILIDVISLTHPDRIGIFKNRISPLQISWLAYCNTVGFDTIDYLISDKYLVKDGEEKYYAEKIIKMSNIWSSHSGFSFIRKFQELPFLDSKQITFGSFNNFMKISDEVVETWSNILKKVKNSRLILKSSETYNYEIIKNKFKKLGVNNSIKILNKNDFENTEDHLNLYNKIDIALDTFPYTGVTTTFEALWKGIPVITMAGHNFKSRCGESILKNAKLESLICSDSDDYINKTLKLVRDIDNLKILRTELFSNILKTPLFDNMKYTMEFEKILLTKYSEKNYK